MTLSTLRARAARKRARIAARCDTYTVIDTHTDLVIGTADGLLALEDLVAWIDQP